MAMKKKADGNRPAAHNDDSVIYKVMIALGILCVAVLGLQMVGRTYGTADGITSVKTLVTWGAVIFGAAALVVLILGLFRGKQMPRLRKFYLPLFVVLALFAFACFALRQYWVSPLPYLYFIFIAATVLYMIFLLYQMEFFLLSLCNVAAGLVFYLLSQLYPDGRGTLNSLILNVGLVILLAVVATLAFLAARNGGKIKWKEDAIRVFQPRFSPVPLYLTMAIWLVCLIAAFFLGSTLAYYCMFGAAAWELVCAVYYTFKLS